MPRLLPVWTEPGEAAAPLRGKPVNLKPTSTTKTAKPGAANAPVRFEKRLCPPK
jgi:hypothetical protein